MEELEKPRKFPIVDSWRDTVEVASKVGVAAIAVAYIVGLLVLNFHIRKYGIYYLSFLQIEYVMAGILWAFLVGLIYCFSYLVLYRIKTSFNEERQKGIKRVWQIGWQVTKVLFALFALFSSLSFVLSILSDNELTMFKQSNWKVVGVLILNAAALSMVGTKMRDATKHFLSGQQTEEIDGAAKRASFFDVFYNVALFVSMLSFYSNSVFPHLSPVFGGGKKQKAEFIIKPEEVETINIIGIQMEPNSRHLGPLEVIFEASDFFSIAPPLGFNNNKVKALRIRKDMIDAAFYINEKEN
jgi:hypothetical protein